MKIRLSPSSASMASAAAVALRALSPSPSPPSAAAPAGASASLFPASRRAHSTPMQPSLPRHAPARGARERRRLTVNCEKKDGPGLPSPSVTSAAEHASQRM